MNESPPPRVTLRLDELSSGIPALTPSLGLVHAESAAVCLADQGHATTAQLHLRDRLEPQYELQRSDVTDEMRRAYADMGRATELGACGVALLLIRQVTGLTAIHQSRKGTGFDYWLGPANSTGLVFQEAARLEVSGLLTGTETQFKSRLKQKLQQPARSDDTRLPAYAVVVEFSRPQAQVAER